MSTRGALIQKIKRLEAYLVKRGVRLEGRGLSNLAEDLQSMKNNLKEYEEEEKRKSKMANALSQTMKQLYPLEQIENGTAFDEVQEIIIDIQRRAEFDYKREYYFLKCLNNEVPEWLATHEMRFDRVPYVIRYNFDIHSKTCLAFGDIEWGDDTWEIYVIFDTDTFVVEEVVLMTPNVDDTLEKEEDKERLKASWSEGGFGFLCGTNNWSDGLFHCWSTGNPDYTGFWGYELSEEYKEIVTKMQKWGKSLIK